MKVNASSGVGGMLLSPAGSEESGSAKIFADFFGIHFIMAFVHPSSKVEIGFHMLDGGFI